MVILCTLALCYVMQGRVSDIPADSPSPARGRSVAMCGLEYKIERGCRRVIRILSCVRRVRALLVRSDHNSDMTMIESPLIRFLRHRQFINRLSSRKDPTVYRWNAPHTRLMSMWPISRRSVRPDRALGRFVLALARNGKPS